MRMAPVSGVEHERVRTVGGDPSPHMVAVDAERHTLLVDGRRMPGSTKSR